MIIREVRQVTPVTIPESKAELEITVENLRNLPDGASFSEKQGQAEVKVVYVPGEKEYIVVTGTCDSLQVLCESLERDLIHLREDTEIEKTEIKENNFKRGFMWGAGSIALLGILIALAWATIKRKIKL